MILVNGRICLCTLEPYSQNLEQHIVQVQQGEVFPLCKKTSDSASQWFSTFHSLFPLSLCLPLGDAGKKVFCCSLNRNKYESELYLP